MQPLLPSRKRNCKPILKSSFQIGAVALLSAALLACGPAVRTTDGDCYYRGKGLLSTVATVLDGAVAYADAELEAAYQRDQINLHNLGTQLDAIDRDSLHSDSDIDAYNHAVDEHNRLLASVEQHQERKQQRLKEGPATSFSKQVDESGDCE